MIKTMLKSVATAAVMVTFSAGLAQAQETPATGCLEETFTAKNYEFYGKAETELLVNDNPQGALAALSELLTKELNCYERGAALRLGAAIKLETEDYLGAVQDLEQALDMGIIPEGERQQTYYNIAQIYLSISDKDNALVYFNRWLASGAQPTRDQKWTLAVIYQQMDRPEDALRWAEQVFAADGPNADRSVYDFLIYLYDKTGNLVKKAQLLEQLLARNPTERRLWDAIAGDYFRGGEDRKAFEVQKAMYLGGILQTEDELMRIVNFYNSLNVPFQAAKILEKEMNAGKISKNYTRLELLANLYQVAREYDKAIPVIEEAARISSDGQMYERLGRSYSELREWAKAEEALLQAINKGGLKDRGLAWVLVGQSRYERNDRSGAREAFRSANNRGGRGWIDFMASEDFTARQLVIFEATNLVSDYMKEKDRCKELEIINNAPESCETVDDRLADARAELSRLQGDDA